MAAVTICSDFGAQKNKVWHCFPHLFLSYGTIEPQVFKASSNHQVFKASSQLTLEFTRACSHVGNRGFKLETVSFPPHKICKIGNLYGKVGYFTKLHKLTLLATLGIHPAWQHLSLPPADKAEIGTVPQLHSNKSVFPAWPRGFESPTWWHHTTHEMMRWGGGGMADQEIIRPGPRVSLAKL